VLCRATKSEHYVMQECAHGAHQKDAYITSLDETGARCDTRKASREMWIVVISVNDEAERSRLVTRACMGHVSKAEMTTKHVPLDTY